NAAGLRQSLQARGDIHTITKKITPADHHVTYVNADAEVDALVRRQAAICLGESRLHLNRALHRVDGAGELRKDAVACRIRDPAPVLDNGLVEDRAPLGQPLERPYFVRTHEAAVAFHVSREDCHQPTIEFDML